MAMHTQVFGPADSILEIYTKGHSLWEELEPMSPKDPNYKKTVNDAISCFQKVAGLVEQHNLFSDNEVFDDIPTASLK